MRHALEVSDLSFAYDTEAVLNGISFEIGEEESVGIVGANGSGKSTLLWCLAGILQSKGRVLLFGGPPERRTLARLGMVFQNPEDQLFMPTILQDLALPLINSGVAGNEARQRADATLRDFGLEKFRERPATHLSLGQRKRAAVALALVRQPELLLFDEPTAELDGKAVRQLALLLRSLTVAKLVASHDLRFLREVTSRSLVLAGGRVIADGRTETVLADEDLLERAGLV